MKSSMSKPTKKDVMDAIQYFWEMGYIEELTGDRRHFVTILLKCCADKYNIELVENDDE